MILLWQKTRYVVAQNVYKMFFKPSQFHNFKIMKHKRKEIPITMMSNHLDLLRTEDFLRHKT